MTLGSWVAKRAPSKEGPTNYSEGREAEFSPTTPSTPAASPDAPFWTRGRATLAIIIGLGVFATMGLLLSGGENAKDWPPPVRASVSVYEENLDGDYAEEVVSYVELFDAEGQATVCSCDVKVRIRDGETSSWVTILEQPVVPSDFEERTIGLGDFARKGTVVSVTIDDQYVRCGAFRSYEIAYVVTLADGSKVSDGDTVLRYC